MRIAFRELIKFIIGEPDAIYYTNFIDEILEVKEHEGDFSVNNMQDYRKKINQYLNEHGDDMVVHKLRNNKPLAEQDIQHLEQILWHNLGTKADYEKEFGDEPLLKLVSKIVGLEPIAANQLFSEFLSDESLNINQMEFVKQIVHYIIKNGSLDKRELNEHPFNQRGSVVDLFDDKLDVAKKIIGTIDQLNNRLSV